MDKDGRPDGGWYLNEKVSREEALKAFTIWAAYGQFEEDIKGSLTAGKLADFVVIDRDYMTCPESDIKDIQAVLTVCGGEVVYEKDASRPIITWQGKIITLNDDARLENGMVRAPLNDVVSFINATAEKSGATATVTYQEKSVKLPVETVDGVDYVAVRALFEGIGYRVTWCQNSWTVSTSRAATA